MSDTLVNRLRGQYACGVNNEFGTRSFADFIPAISLEAADRIEELTKTKPNNNIGATHWAELPDKTILFYKVGNDVLLWFPLTERWDEPDTVPYSLYSFDDEI